MNLDFLHLRFDRPELLWLLWLSIPIVYLGVKRLTTLDGVRRWTAIALRLTVLWLIVFMLAGMQAVQTHSDLTVIAMMDQSQSVRRFVPDPDHPAAEPGGEKGNHSTIEQWANQWIRQAVAGRRTDDRFAMLTFDGRPTVRQLPQNTLDTDLTSDAQPTPGTNLAAAIRTGMALAPSDSASRLLLITDGNDTASKQNGGSSLSDSEVIQAADEAAAAGIPIDVLPLHYKLSREVMVQGVYVTNQARVGQTVAVRVVLRASQPAVGTLQLLHEGEPIDLNGSKPGTGTPVTRSDWTLQTQDPRANGNTNQAGGKPQDVSGKWMAVKSINVTLRDAGANEFTAVFEPDAGQDTLAGNNTAKAFTLVHGKGRVLFVNDLPTEAGAILPRTLARHGIRIQTINPAQFPDNLAQLQHYDAVVFQNVPAELISQAQQKMLAKYVNDLGGGFLMIGGPKSFGAGGWTHSPVDRILPVNCQIPSQTVLPSGALMLVMDRSGSMGSPVAGTNKTQQELANEAAVRALHTLYPQDLIGVVAFDSTAYSIVKVQMNSNPAEVAKRIRSIQSGGGTNIYSGLEMAYQQLAPLTVQDAAIKHVILLTDGQSTNGNYIKLIGEMRQAHITLSTVGVGDSVDQGLLQKLANMGGGHFYLIHDPKHLPQIFIKEARTIRKNLIKEKLFQPKLISTGSPVMQGIHSLPDLKGLVLTGRKQDPRVFLPIVAPSGEPVFAHWQVGLGRAAAFTSDADNRWATAWLQNPIYGDFWPRVIRRIARPSESRNANLITTIRGDTLHIRLDAVGGSSSTSDAFANFLNVRGTILKPGGKTQSVTLHQTGPGVYQTSVPAGAAGNYIVSLIDQQPNGKRFSIFGGTSRPPGAELRQFESNNALLKRIATLTGGKILSVNHPQDAGLYKRSSDLISRSVRPIWPTLLAIMLAIFLLDVASRRIAWSVGDSWAWTKQKAAGAASLLRSRNVDAQSTLGALKHRQQQTEAEFKKRAAGKEVSDQPAAPSRKQKFEASPDTVAQENFAQAVGGATPQAGKSSQPRGDSGGQDEDLPTTGRLLDAKRRTRQRYSDQQ